MLGSEHAWDVFAARVQSRLQPAQAQTSNARASQQVEAVLVQCGAVITQALSHVHAHLMKSLSAVDKELLPASARHLAYRYEAKRVRAVPASVLTV